MLQNIHLFHGVPNRHILSGNSPVSSVYAIDIVPAYISNLSWLKDVSIALPGNFYYCYPFIQLKLAAQNIPFFNDQVYCFKIFQEHLLIKLNWNFQILKKNSTFRLKFDYLGEHFLGEWSRREQLHKKVIFFEK